jgi:hypothetical protein
MNRTKSSVGFLLQGHHLNDLLVLNVGDADAIPILIGQGNR